MIASSTNNFKCKIVKDPDKAWLEAAWSDLELRSPDNFFLSWVWIGTWLDCFVDSFSVIEARRSGLLVGLGILVRGSNCRNEKSYKTKYYLHRTGANNEDQIWIEYNDFLMDADWASELRSAMMSQIIDTLGITEALVVGASDADKYDEIEGKYFLQRKTWHARNYWLDLDKVRSTPKSLLASLSKNARYQINRSLRKYKTIGDIELKRANSAEEANEMFQLAKPYHIARWGIGGTGSGFSNVKFVQFHNRLIKTGFDAGVIEVKHITVGGETLAVIYNFRYKNKEYFYLSAINYCYSASHFKPGLVAHYLVIDQALVDGIEVYDFMGGTARYKATFANMHGNLAIYQFERDSLLLKVEKCFRRFKRNWTKVE